MKDGANEIDIVIERGMVLRGDWQALYDEVRAMRKACGDAHIKTILGTGELATLNNVAKASLVCMLAGADFIKTSTGKEKVNANLQTSLAMVRMIRWFHEETGIEIGYKPAGGIATAKARARLHGADEGRARHALAAAAPVPLRRVSRC